MLKSQDSSVVKSVIQKWPIRRFLVDSWHYLPATVLPALFSLVAVSIFTRIFTAEEYGVFSFILAITGPTVTALVEWAAQPVGRFYAEYKEQNKLELYYKVVSILVIIPAFLSLLLSFFVFIICFLVTGSFFKPVLFFSATFSVITQSLSAIVIRILPASFKAVTYKRATILTAGLSLVLPLILCYFLGAEVAWLFLGSALAQLILLPYIYFHARISLKLSFPLFTPDVSQTIKRFWRYGAPMTLWFFSAGLLDLGDRYIILLFKGSEQVGIYNVNYNLVSQLVGFINVPFLAAAGPLLMNLWAKGEIDKASKTISQLSDIYFLFTCCLMGWVTLVGNNINILLLGSSFREGSNIFLPVLAGKILWCLSMIGHKGIEFIEQTHVMFWFSIIAAIVNLLLNFVFVPVFGYQGSAYATFVGYLTYSCLVWYYSKKTLPWQIPWNSIVLSLITTFLSWIFSFMFIEPLHGTTLLTLVVSSFAYLLIWLSITLAVRFKTFKTIFSYRNYNR